MELPATVAAKPKAAKKPTKPVKHRKTVAAKPKAAKKPKQPPKPWDGRGIKQFEGLVELKIPVGVSGRYVPRRIRTDVRDITSLQRTGLNILMEGLRESDAELNGGQPVNNHVNAIRWLLETIAKSAEPQLEVIPPPE